jgi:hypothetical protein
MAARAGVSAAALAEVTVGEEAEEEEIGIAAVAVGEEGEVSRVVTMAEEGVWEQELMADPTGVAAAAEDAVFAVGAVWKREVSPFFGEEAAAEEAPSSAKRTTTKQWVTATSAEAAVSLAASSGTAATPVIGAEMAKQANGSAEDSAVPEASREARTAGAAAVDRVAEEIYSHLYLTSSSDPPCRADCGQALRDQRLIVMKQFFCLSLFVIVMF